jgi:hypothetical protein
MSSAAPNVTTGRRMFSCFDTGVGDMPSPDRVSHASWLSGFGVPVGVLFALVSTRLCLDPDLGVMLLARNTGAGETTLSRPLLFGIGSDRCCPRLASGVTIAAV